MHLLLIRCFLANFFCKSFFLIKNYVLKITPMIWGFEPRLPHAKDFLPLFRHLPALSVISSPDLCAQWPRPGLHCAQFLWLLIGGVETQSLSLQTRSQTRSYQTGQQPISGNIPVPKNIKKLVHGYTGTL